MRLLPIALCLAAAFVAQACLADDVWISIRSDRKKGRGTQLDPFDGSSPERLDWLLGGIAPKTMIHFGAGVFVTGGIQAREGWRVYGLGKKKTILKLANGALVEGTPGSTRAVIFEYDFQGFLRYFEMANLTIDCNRANQPAFQKNLRGYSLDAWVIAAKSAKISNVRAVGTWANPGEGFPCRVYHDGSRDPGDRIEINECENINPIGYLTAISVFDQAGGLVSGSIRDCRVLNHPGGAAFGAGGWRNFKVIGNYARNVGNGIVIDTNDYHHVDIARNHFHGINGWAVLYNGKGVYDDIRIHDNVFEMSPAARGAALRTGDAKTTTRIYDNTFVQTDTKIPILAKGKNTESVLKNNVVRQRHHRHRKRHRNWRAWKARHRHQKL